MKIRLIYLITFLHCICLFSCQNNGDKVQVTNTQAMLLTLKEASEKLKQNPDLDARLSFWNKQLSNPKFKTDPVLLSKIHYNIAGVFYAKNELDSIKNHMQLAWELMENTRGYDDDKTLLYSGLGNIAHLEQKVHQENYYYNRAGQMLLADTALKLTPKQKITIYFSAAQSSAKLRQFDNAFTLNRKAMELLPQIKDNSKDEFRAYSQMAVCFLSSNRSLDSLYSYIKRMEKLYNQRPTEQDARFVFDRKASYFTKKNNIDSALFYNRKRLAMDIADEKDNGISATSVRTGNLYTSYNDMAGLFIEHKELDSADYFLKKCVAFTKKYPGKVDEEKIVLYEQNLIYYLFATKKYLEVERQQYILQQRTRFLYESENARAIAEMSTVFQLQVKDKSIHNLNETVILSNAKLQQNRLLLAVSTLAFLLAISLALLLYFIQRQRKLKNQTERVQLEQRLLRTQIEPHFIFNTLSALQSFIRFNENEKALKYIHQFGRLLRNSLQLSRESLVKLSEEIETLENYLSLQQMRYDDTFMYQINVDHGEDIERIYIPPMLMQPFVENAILHGINPNGKNGIITVDFDIKERMLTVTIKDNGKGISKAEESPAHKSLATTISKERLAIIAKESGLPAGIDIISEEHNGTIVLIYIPIRSA